MKYYEFDPDDIHCPTSCLCPLCKNDNECDTACKVYKQMANGCTNDEEESITGHKFDRLGVPEGYNSSRTTEWRAYADYIAGYTTVAP